MMAVMLLRLCLGEACETIERPVPAVACLYANVNMAHILAAELRPGWTLKAWSCVPPGVQAGVGHVG